MDKLKVFTAFSGYDSQCMALDRLGLDYELVGWSEIDKYAIIAHNAVYPQWKDRNFGDISKIDWNDVPDFDLFTYSFPCTDISSAGQQKGLEEGSGTRSSLLWECRKAIEAKRPKYLMMENVKALTSKKFMPYLKMWLNYLSGLGYSNYTQVLNAKDYGVPQNRERVFAVSVLGDECYEFPKPFELKLRLKDVLESNVDESYYLKRRINGELRGKFGNKRVQSLTESGKINKNEVQFLDAYNQGVHDVCGTIKTTIDSSCMSFIAEPSSCAMRGRNPNNPSDRNPGIELEQRLEIGGDIANCITTVQKDSLVAEPKLIGCTRDKKGRVVDRHFQDIANTVHTSTGSGGNTDCFVVIPDDVERLNDVCKETEKEIIGISVNPNSRKLEFKGFESIAPISQALRATDYKCPHVAWESDEPIEYKGKKLNEGDGLYLHNSSEFDNGALEGISRTLKATKFDSAVVQNYRIRKLTPRECFRLMGVSEENIDKIQNSGISKTQQYKMAGNSIVVDVLCHIFRKLFIDKDIEDLQLELFNK